MKIVKNIICCSLILLVITNLILPNFSYAVTNPDPLAGNWGSGLLDGALGIILYPVKIALIVPGLLINMILTSIVGVGGELREVTLQGILFDEYKLTSINVFEIPEGTAQGVVAIRESIAQFYIAFRNLAIVLSLVMLIYIGIRMAISSIAEEKAKYKQMLVNWVVGFGLIFILHYIIIFTINANELLVRGLNTGVTANTDFMNDLLAMAWKPALTTSIACIIIYSVLLIMTFSFLVVYIKRMLTISFLMIIAPLISVTYAVDKVGNNKSEILNTWLREFFYNVLIQPFHCLLYSVFAGMAMEFVSQTGHLDFGAMVFAIIMISSIYLGEKIIKEIFGFGESKSLAQKIAVIALATNAVKNIKGTVALRGAANDIRAHRSIRNLPKEMPDGSKRTLDSMAASRAQAEQNRMGEQNGAPQTQRTSATTSSGSGTKTTVKKRRPLKNAPKPIKRAARFVGRTYGNFAGTVTGYNLIKNNRDKRKKSRNYKMTQKDYFIAASESYRSTQKVPMSNEELANKVEELYNKNFNEIVGPEDTNYKVWIETMKKEFGKKGQDALQEMKDSIINGSNQNKRWEK